MFKKLLWIVAMVFAAAMGIAHADYTIDSVTIESQENVKMGSSVAVTVKAQASSPNLRLKIEVPEGLEIIGSPTQEVGQNRQYTWNVIGRRSGTYAITAYATDGTVTKIASKQLQVTFNKISVTAYPSKYFLKPGESFKVTGTVKDNSGALISAARVEVSIGSKKFVATTDTSGAYSVDATAGTRHESTIIITASKEYLTGSTSEQVAVSENPQQNTGSPGTGSGPGDTTQRKKVTINILDVSKNVLTADSICANGVCVYSRQSHTFEVTQGTAYIEVKKVGYQAHRLDLQVVDGARHNIMLEKLTGDGFAEIVVRSFETDEVLNAKVSVASGASYTIKGNTRIVLSPGQHGIIVEADGYLKDYRIINVQPGATTLVAFSVKKDAMQSTVPTQSKSSAQDGTIGTVGIWILWISAIASVLTLGSAFYLHYFGNPLKETESFENNAQE